jgi:hypothetical protein
VPEGQVIQGIVAVGIIPNTNRVDQATKTGVLNLVQTGISNIVSRDSETDPLAVKGAPIVVAVLMNPGGNQKIELSNARQIRASLISSGIENVVIMREDSQIGGNLSTGVFFQSSSPGSVQVRVTQKENVFGF